MVDVADTSMNHLHPSIHALLQADDRERIRNIKSPKWVGYKKAEEGLNLLEDLLDHPKHHRMPGLLIYGETNNGKTMLSQRFIRDHPAEDNPTGNSANIPVLHIQMPPDATMRDFFISILDAGFASYGERDSIAVLRVNTLNHLRVCGTRMLIIDEFHNMLQGSGGKTQRGFMALIRFLINELQIPIVCFGTEKARIPFKYDAQLSNRFERFELPNWKYDREYARFLNSYERLLPLRRKSNLIEPKLAKYIIEKAEFTIGEVADLLKKGAIHAIKSGAEIIDREVLEQSGYKSPSNPDRQPPSEAVAQRLMRS